MKNRDCLEVVPIIYLSGYRKKTTAANTTKKLRMADGSYMNPESGFRAGPGDSYDAA